MIKTVYADVLFLLNFIIDYLLLFLTARITATVSSRFRLLSASLLGALYALLFLVPNFLFLTYFPFKFMFSFALILIAFGCRNFLRIYLTFFASSASFAGICLLSSRLFFSSLTFLGAGIYYANLSLPTLLATTGASYVLLRIIFSRRGTAKTAFCDISIENLGKSISLCALSDSGNSLCDESSNEQIVISDYATLRKILPRDAVAVLDKAEDFPFYLQLDKLSEIRGFGVVPYKTVGVSFSLLLTYRPEKIYINRKLSKRAVCAISQTPISCGDGFNAII